jgi:hypothetical protein
MKRIWSIEEQTFNDPASGFALEFASGPADPSDQTLVMKLHNAARDKVLVITFARNGLRLSSDIESPSVAVQAEPGVESPPVQQEPGTAAAPVEENTDAMAGDIDRQGPDQEGLVKSVTF